MALAAVKTWNAGDVLFAADLNAMNTNILNNALTLISPLTGNLNCNLKQLQSAVLENLAADPAAATVGRIWYNTASQSIGYDPGSSAPTVTFPVAGYQANCRLTYVTSSAIRLVPYNGNKIPIKTASAWDLWTIPSTGIDLSSTGFTNTSSQNYVYCFNSAGTLTLAAQTSSFGHATSTESGVEIMTTDATRTLVGMCYTSTANAGFFSTVGTTGGTGTLNNTALASYYNRRSVSYTLGFTSNQIVGAGAFAEISSIIRVPFLTWADEAVQVGAQGACRSTSNGTIATAIAFDQGATVEDSMSIQQVAVISAVQPVGLSLTKAGLAEGIHFATLSGSPNGSTGEWFGGAVGQTGNPAGRTSLCVSVRV